MVFSRVSSIQLNKSVLRNTGENNGFYSSTYSWLHCVAGDLGYCGGVLMNILELYNYAVEFGGATMDIHGKVPKTGYAVGIYPVAEFGGALTCRNIELFISRNYKLLRKPNTYVGIWWDFEHDWIFDVSAVVEDLNDAIDLAHEHDQDCIYDLANDLNIPIKEPTTPNRS
jgi:hypothetical protein